MRQYWRDFDALDRGGTSVWHETYFRRGGFESMYVDADPAVGMARSAPTRPATGPMLAAVTAPTRTVRQPQRPAEETD